MSFSGKIKKLWRAAALLSAKKSPPPPLSYEQALFFFDELANREDLALGYPHEACFARCHLMCAAALLKGYVPKKAWAIDDEALGIMNFVMPNGAKVNYWCHTAVTLPVKTPGNDIHELVFDPALLDGPVPLKEWGKVINAPPEYLEIKRLGKPPTNYVGDYDTSASTQQALAHPHSERHPLKTIRHYQSREVIPRTVFASRYCRDFIFPALGHWPERRGVGWTSTDPYPKPHPSAARRATMRKRVDPDPGPKK